MPRNHPNHPTHWKPGQSGNPNGRAKGLPRRIKELFGEDGNELINILASIARGETTVETQKVLKSARGIEVLTEDVVPSIAERMQAVKMLLDHGYGMPVQRVEALISDAVPINASLIESFDANALDALARLVGDQPQPGYIEPRALAAGESDAEIDSTPPDPSGEKP